MYLRVVDHQFRPAGGVRDLGGETTQSTRTCKLVEKGASRN